MAKRMRKAVARPKSPVASETAKPRMAWEKSHCFRVGFLASPKRRLPNTDPVPGPEPATPTAVAPATLAAGSMSLKWRWF